MEIKRAKEVTPSKLIDIPAPGEKIKIKRKNEQSKPSIKNDSIKIIMDQKSLKMDVPPQIIKGRTLVPLRGIFEEYGAMVNWDSISQVIKAKKGNINVELKIGKKAALINGAEKNLDVPAQVISSRALVPLRFISESMGLKVNWDIGKQTVEILTLK